MLTFALSSSSAFTLRLIQNRRLRTADLSATTHDQTGSTAHTLTVCTLAGFLLGVIYPARDDGFGTSIVCSNHTAQHSARQFGQLRGTPFGVEEALEFRVYFQLAPTNRVSGRLCNDLCASQHSRLRRWHVFQILNTAGVTKMNTRNTRTRSHHTRSETGRDTEHAHTSSQ